MCQQCEGVDSGGSDGDNCNGCDGGADGKDDGSGAVVDEVVAVIALHELYDYCFEIILQVQIYQENLRVCMTFELYQLRSY